MYLKKQKTKSGKFIYSNKSGKITKEKYYENLKYNKLQTISKNNHFKISKNKFKEIKKRAIKENISYQKEVNKYVERKRKQKLNYIKRTYNLNIGEASEVFNLSIVHGTNYKKQAEFVKNGGGMGGLFSADKTYLDIKQETELNKNYRVNINIKNAFTNESFQYSGDVSGLVWKDFREFMESFDSDELDNKAGTPYGILADILKVDYIGGMPGEESGINISLSNIMKDED
jgi:hypothetical protein